MARSHLRYALLLAGLLLVTSVHAAGQPTPAQVKQVDQELEEWKKTDPTQYKLMVAMIQMTLGHLAPIGE
jgi:hypothetical protein